jgi:hypothetical protein
MDTDPQTPVVGEAKIRSDDRCWAFISEDLVLRHVLFPPFLSTDPLAKNYQKIFFFKKR